MAEAEAESALTDFLHKQLTNQLSREERMHETISKQAAKEGISHSKLLQCEHTWHRRTYYTWNKVTTYIHYNFIVYIEDLLITNFD